MLNNFDLDSKRKKEILFLFSQFWTFFPNFIATFSVKFIYFPLKNYKIYTHFWIHIPDLFRLTMGSVNRYLSVYFCKHIRRSRHAVIYACKVVMHNYRKIYVTVSYAQLSHRTRTTPRTDGQFYLHNIFLIEDNIWIYSNACCIWCVLVSGIVVSSV